MTAGSSLHNEQLGLFLDLAQASYRSSIPDCFSEVNPQSRDKHRYEAIAREDVESYPMYLIRYVDSVGRRHLAVSVKGLFGEKENATVSNGIQAAGAAAYHFLADASVLPRAIQKVIDAWQQSYGKIDTAVSHSGGCRITAKIHEYLQSKEQPIQTVTFNGQRPTIAPGLINVRTKDDWLTTDNPQGTFLHGNPIHTVGEGGHSLKDFSASAHLTLKEIEEAQRGIRFDEVKKEALTLQKKIGIHEPPSDVALQEAENFAVKLQLAEEAEKRKLELHDNIILGAKIGCTLASGLENWQRNETAAMVAESSKRAQQEQLVRGQEFQECHEASVASMQMYRQVLPHLDMSRWSRDQFITGEAELSRHLAKLKNNVSKWRAIQSKLQVSKDQASLQRATLLEKKIAGGQKIITRILNGISNACDVGALAAMKCPPASVALGLAGRIFSAGAAFSDRNVTAEELHRQEELARLEHQASLFGMREGQADERGQLHDQAYLEALNRVVSSEQISPWVRRKAIEDRISYWKLKQEKHEGQKKELLEKIYPQYVTQLDLYPSHIAASGVTDTLSKREHFAREGYRQTTEGRAWEEGHRALSETVALDQKELERELAVASIRDRGYKIAEHWGTYWSPSDGATRDFSKALDEQVQLYWNATMEERQSISRTFAAFEDLAMVMGAGGLQRTAAIGRNAYTMVDLLRYADTTAFPNLSEARKGPGSFLKNIGGLTKLLSGYLVPALEFVVCGIRIAQMIKGEELPPSEAEIRTRQLHCLSQQLSHLENSVLEIRKQLHKQDRALHDGFDQAFQSIRELRGGIEEKIRQIGASTNRKLDEQEYKRVTRARKATLGEFGDILTKGRHRRHDCKSLEKFSGVLITQCQRIERDIESGACLPDSAGELVIPEYTSLIHCNPSHHTATLLSLIEGENLAAPNLQHYLQIVVNYFYAVELQDQVVDVSAQTKENLRKVHESLLKQGHQLLVFIRLYDKACSQAAGTQKSLLKDLCDRLNKTLKTEEASRLAEAKKAASKLIDGSFNEFAGESRFGLISAFVNEAKPHLISPPSDEILEQASQKYPMLKDSVLCSAADGAKHFGVIGGGSFGLVGSSGGPLVAAIFGGIGFLGGAAVGGVTGGVCGVANPIFCDWKKDIVDDHESFKKHTISEDGRLKISNKEKFLKWHVVTTRRIHRVFVNCVTFRMFPEYPFRNIYDSDFQGEKFEVLILNCDQIAEKGEPKRYNISASINPGLISSDEITQLPQGQIPYGYNDLLKDYLTIAASRNPARRFDQTFLDESVWVPSAHEGYVPLAFPKVLVALFEHEKRKLAVQGLQFKPCYSFTPKEDRFELALEFFVGEQKHSSLVLATFDELAVRSFGAPIVDDQGLSHEAPNLNEFLITAMYTSFQEGVGFPGKDTVILRDGMLIAPVDVPFSGVYRLLEKELSEGNHRMIQFDSTTYAGNDEVMKGELKLVSHAPRLDGKDPLETKYQDYCLRYQVLKAMYALQLDVKLEDLDKDLSGAGLLLTTSGAIEDIYFQIAASPQIGGLMDDPVEARLKRLPITARPLSRVHQGLIGALARLEPKADELIQSLNSQP